MSLLSKESIKIIGETVGISSLSDEVASALASDVEYRLREIAQVRMASSYVLLLSLFSFSCPSYVTFSSCFLSPSLHGFFIFSSSSHSVVGSSSPPSRSTFHLLLPTSLLFFRKLSSS
jgi:hypothetical protein